MPSSTNLATTPIATPAKLRSWLTPRLLRWFDRVQRPLPWRRDADPYRIWISEVMLQQTQVATVIPYFERFMATFPTVAELAAATVQQVLQLWEGLGYYRRARALHAAARQIVGEHAGQLPNDPEIVSRLPGFGRYTCNAVLSQAFDRRLPIVEANSQRVLSRLFARRDDPKSPAARKWLWDAAEQLLPRHRVGGFNQALMELGALICTPRQPDCDRCPLKSRCAARQFGCQDSIPPPTASLRPTLVRESAVVIRRDNEVLLLQRSPSATRWPGLWEVPHAALDGDETHQQAATRLVAELTGLTVQLKEEIGTIRHAVTRFRIEMVCFEAVGAKGAVTLSEHIDHRWIAMSQWGEYPVSAPQRKLADLLNQPHRQRHLF